MSCAVHRSYRHDCNACRAQEQNDHQLAQLRALNEQLSAAEQHQQAGLAEALRQTQLLEESQQDQQAFHLSQYLQTPAGVYFQKWREAASQVADALESFERDWQKMWESHVRRVADQTTPPPSVPKQRLHALDIVLAVLSGGLTAFFLSGIVAEWFVYDRSMFNILVFAVLAFPLFNWFMHSLHAPRRRREALEKKRDAAIDELVTDNLEKTFGFDPRDSRPWADGTPGSSELRDQVTRWDADVRTRYPQPAELPALTPPVIRANDPRLPAELGELLIVAGQEFSTRSPR